MIPVRIEEDRLDDVLSVLNKIPEFDDIPDEQKIMGRLKDVPHLLLTAYKNDEPVGCKIGYARDGSFYSWLGAIVPDYRNQGVASALADYQEDWARKQGFTSVWMKTRNGFPHMLIMAVHRGFKVVGFDPREEIDQHRIVLRKSL